MPLDPVRRAVLTDIAFEIGGQGLAGFPRMLSAIHQGLWATAATELKDSLLFEQVPQREQENLMALATGLWPPRVSDARGLVRKHEGCNLLPQPDAKGKWCVGWGHDIAAPAEGAALAEIAQTEADRLFEADFLLAEERARLDLGPDMWGEG